MEVNNNFPPAFMLRDDSGREKSMVQFKSVPGQIISRNELLFTMTDTAGRRGKGN